MTDPILLWNGVALEANRVSHTNGQGEQAGPSLSAHALAIVHLAMHDAYAGIINDDNATSLPRYMNDPEAPHIDPDERDAAAAAAVAGAAHTTLSDRFPSQKSYFDSILTATGIDPKALAPGAIRSGYDFGKNVAEAILKGREGDPGSGGVYKPKLEHGKHRPDPDNPGQGFYSPEYGNKIKSFALTTRHDLAPPPFKKNGEYEEEYERAVRQVRGKGIKPELMGALPHSIDGHEIHKRDVNETVIGIFWGYDGSPDLGTPPRLYNQIAREIARKKPNPDTGTINTPAQNARLFALLNVALADAGILCWEQKYRHELWRPVIGIREHDNSMGLTDDDTKPTDKMDEHCDPFWLPLGGPFTNRVGKNFTPNFPSYPSGHATFGAAALHMIRLFYRQGGKYSDNSLSNDHLSDGLEFVSEELNNINTDNTGAKRPRHVRNFPGGLWQMIEENGRSRVYLGVHWVFDAFAEKEDGTPDLAKRVDGKVIGGVPLGLLVAEDIFEHAQTPGWKSTVDPLPEKADAAKNRTETYSSSFQPSAPASPSGYR